MENNAVLASLLKVQQELKAPKDKHNNFGNYSYRSAESIFEAAKPLCHANGLILTCADDMVAVGSKVYCKATARVTDIVNGAFFETTAFAREDDSKKGMDGCQLTGCCSSYARKYAMCGLFAIDDNKDADTNEYRNENAARAQQVRPQQPAPQPARQQAQQQPAQGNARDAFVKTIMAQAIQQGVEMDTITAIIKSRYNKSTSKYLTTAEAKEFSENFDRVVVEYEAQRARA